MLRYLINNKFKLGASSSDRLLYCKQLKTQAVLAKTLIRTPAEKAYIFNSNTISHLKSQTMRMRPLSSSSTANKLQRKVRHIFIEKGEKQVLKNVKEKVEAGATFDDICHILPVNAAVLCEKQPKWVSPSWNLQAQVKDAMFSDPVGSFTELIIDDGVYFLDIVDERYVAEIKDMTVFELEEQLQNFEDAQFIDVREQNEYDIARLDHFKLYPLSKVLDWSDYIDTDLDKKKKTICLCHHGVRSRRIASILVDKGFKNVYNVVGGIDAYSKEISKSVPRY